MRDYDIPNVLKVKNPGPETFSLAGLFSLPPGKVTDVQLGALHDSRRATAYASVLNSIAGGVIEFVSGPENFKLPQSVANAVSRREKTDVEGVIAAQRATEALANRPDGTPTLPTIKPPGQQPVAIAPTSNPVGNESDDEFSPPAPPTATIAEAHAAPPAPVAEVVAAPVLPPPPLAPVVQAPKGKGKAAPKPPDSDPVPASAISDL
jgi:hypothetical protein